MRDFHEAKAMARVLRDLMATRGLALSHSEALETVARQLGMPNWNVLSARIEADAGGRDQNGRPGAASGIRFDDAVPIVRIFDVPKAHEFYLGFLGFEVVWEHRFGDDYPLYTEVARGGIRLHLSEHAGDASPGGNMCIYMQGIAEFHRELTDKAYRFMRPGLERTDGRSEMQVTDPFNNRIRFMELDPA